MNQLPRDGEVVAISNNGHFIGRIKDAQRPLETANQPGEWEGFAVETDGSTFAFRQVVSGLYIGGEIRNNAKPLLVAKRDSWENFRLEAKGNGNFVIRSQDNTVLTTEGDQLKWKSQAFGNTDVWNFRTLQQAPQGFNQGFSNQGNQGQGYHEGKVHGHLANWINSFKAQSSSPLPASGSVVAFQNNGNFVGVTKAMNGAVTLTPGNQENERFVIETVGGKFALKQKVSGLYLGGEIDEGRSPVLVSVRNDWEMFVLEQRGNGVAIKNFSNNYLSAEGNQAKWRAHPNNGSEIWTIDYEGNQGGFNQGSGFNQGGFNSGKQGFNQGQQGNNQQFQGFNNSNISSGGLPNSGDTITFSQGGRFVGGVANLNSGLQLTNQAQDWERFVVVPAHEGRFSLQQATSGHYLGGQINNSTTPILVPHNKEWEEFYIENRGNGGIAIKNISKNYLVIENGKLIWRDHPHGGSEVWNFQVMGNGQQGFNQGSGFNHGSGFNQGNQGFHVGNQGQGFNGGNQGFHGNTHGHHGNHGNHGNQGFQGGFQGGFQ